MPGTEVRNKKYRKKAFMRKELQEYRAVILDVDGTLYNQPKLRLLMACALIKYYLLHPARMKELFILRRYRRVRESWKAPDGASAARTDPEEALNACVGGQLGVSPDTVDRIVSHWIRKHPLDLLTRCKDHRLAALIERLKEKGITVAVYSDYPAEEKLAALGIAADFVFSPSHPEIGCMKPDPKGMRAVLRMLHVSGEDALMIGDRYSKDGESARSAGVDYLILPKLLFSRAGLYRSLIP